MRWKPQRVEERNKVFSVPCSGEISLEIGTEKWWNHDGIRGWLPIPRLSLLFDPRERNPSSRINLCHRRRSRCCSRQSTKNKTSPGEHGSSPSIRSGFSLKGAEANQEFGARKLLSPHTCRLLCPSASTAASRRYSSGKMNFPRMGAPAGPLARPFRKRADKHRAQIHKARLVLDNEHRGANARQQI